MDAAGRFETDSWPVIKARHFSRNYTRRKVRVIVLHTMEAPEKGTTAENVARYFATVERPASAHVCVDNNSVVQCVFDNDVAYAAPGCNYDGIQIEMSGYARQTPEEWRDEFSSAMLVIVAGVIAQYSLKFDISIIHLTDDELRMGERGVVGHDQVSRVYKRSTHTDPGPAFPWVEVMAMANAARLQRLTEVRDA